jgi:hypothetical protein
LRQRAGRRCWRRRRGCSLRLGRRGRRRCLGYNGTTRSRLRDRLRGWNGLRTLAGGDSHTTRDNRGGGDAKPSPGDEIASGNDRASAFFSWLGAVGLGRLVAR